MTDTQVILRISAADLKVGDLLYTGRKIRNPWEVISHVSGDRWVIRRGKKEKFWDGLVNSTWCSYHQTVYVARTVVFTKGSFLS